MAPKTVNQKRYVDSIRRNTITFGIGPVSYTHLTLPTNREV